MCLLYAIYYAEEWMRITLHNDNVCGKETLAP